MQATAPPRAVKPTPPSAVVLTPDDRDVLRGLVRHDFIDPAQTIDMGGQIKSDSIERLRLLVRVVDAIRPMNADPIEDVEVTDPVVLAHLTAKLFEEVDYFMAPGERTDVGGDDGLSPGRRLPHVRLERKFGIDRDAIAACYGLVPKDRTRGSYNRHTYVPDATPEETATAVVAEQTILRATATAFADSFRQHKNDLDQAGMRSLDLLLAQLQHRVDGLVPNAVARVAA
jgi:hypothetical protein